jgi:hypothetical protein
VKGQPARFILGHYAKTRGFSNPEDLLWPRVDRQRAPTDCWPWTGYTNTRGYGVIRINRRTVLAHRIAYQVERGPIPDGLFVCHHCDNPPCCNPAHLFLGTQTENMRDMISKGRGNKSKQSK